jgi:alginate O-acetyltransferase complex protein AlgI
MLVSFFFYAWGEPKYILLMISTIAINYVAGLLVERFRGKLLSKVFAVASVVVSLGFLGYFKYADFFIENFNAATGLSVPLLRIALPIGISFYTFQTLSYTVDVYRGDVAAQKNPVTLAAYVTMFPQLIAGPIVRYSDIAKQLSDRTHSFEKFALGIRRFVMGLAKKILIANTLGELCDIFRATDEKVVLYYWLYAVAFSLHIYFDFSGYSDMAIGLGKVFGFDFLENFNYPFVSSSVTEFWRRWHMSLGSWFRDYVYIPLGGNRVSKAKWFFNIFVVWMLTGFWHGAAWNFVVWGLFFAVLLIIEKLFLLRLLEKTKVIKRIYIALAVLISFVIFNATDMAEAIRYIGGMFGAGGIPLINAEMLYYLKSYAVVLVLALIGSTPFVKNAVNRFAEKKAIGTVIKVAEPLVIAVLMIVMTAYLVDGSFNPFLYFRF